MTTPFSWVLSSFRTRRSAILMRQQIHPPARNGNAHFLAHHYASPSPHALVAVLMAESTLAPHNQ